jgi:hypothetical protein
MGKGARLRRERAEGLRSPNNSRWDEIQPGMLMVIPKWRQIKMGATPMMIPGGKLKGKDKFTGQPRKVYTSEPNMKKFGPIRQAMKSYSRNEDVRMGNHTVNV